MKKIYIMSALAVCLFSATACSDFLDREPDKIMTDDQIFGDAVMIKSVLANYYGRVTWGQHINDSYSMTYIDDAAKWMEDRINALRSKMIFGECMIIRSSVM